MMTPELYKLMIESPELQRIKKDAAMASLNHRSISTVSEDRVPDLNIPRSIDSSSSIGRYQAGREIKIFIPSSKLNGYSAHQIEKYKNYCFHRAGYWAKAKMKVDEEPISTNAFRGLSNSSIPAPSSDQKETSPQANKSNEKLDADLSGIIRPAEQIVMENRETKVASGTLAKHDPSIKKPEQLSLSCINADGEKISQAKNDTIEGDGKRNGSVRMSKKNKSFTSDSKQKHIRVGSGNDRVAKVQRQYDSDLENKLPVDKNGISVPLKADKMNSQTPVTLFSLYTANSLKKEPSPPVRKVFGAPPGTVSHNLPNQQILQISAKYRSSVMNTKSDDNAYINTDQKYDLPSTQPNKFKTDSELTPIREREENHLKATPRRQLHEKPAGSNSISVRKQETLSVDSLPTSGPGLTSIARRQVSSRNMTVRRGHHALDVRAKSATSSRELVNQEGTFTSVGGGISSRVPLNRPLTRR